MDVYKSWMSTRLLTFFICFLFLLVDYIGTSEVPVLQPLLFPKGLKLGDPADVVCMLKHGSLPVEFAWRLNGHLLSPDYKVQVFDKQSIVFLGEGVRKEDIGNYTCTATNAFGSDTEFRWLEVEMPPLWKDEPEDVIKAALKSRIRIDCDVMANPAPKITWYRQDPDNGGQLVPLHSDARHDVSANGTLVIYELEEADGGTYICNVSNRFGQLRKEITLNVHTPPRMKEGFRSVTVRRGQTARLECDVIGDLPLEVIWYRKKLKVEPQPGSRYDVRHENTSDGVKAILTVHATQPSDGGLYLCRVEDAQFGDAQGRVKVLVQEPPDPPGGLEVSGVNSRTAQLSWQIALQSEMGESPILSHVVRYWPRMRPHERKEMAMADVDTEAQLKDLWPGTPYLVHVLAENEVGYSEPSDTLEFCTDEEVPISAPTEVKVDPLNTTAVRVNWELPPEEDRNGFLRGFRVTYREEGSEVWMETTVGGGNRTELELGGLSPGTSYTVVLAAYNGAGTGPESQPSAGRTADKDPPEPPVLELVEIGATTALLELRSSAATQYVLEYRATDDTEWSLMHIPGDQPSFRLVGLRSGAHYELRLAAFNEFGQGQFGPPLELDTLEGGPEASPAELPLFSRPIVALPLGLGLLLLLAFGVLVVVILVRRRKHSRRHAGIKHEVSTRVNGSFTNSAATYTRAEDFDAPWNHHEENASSRHPPSKPHTRT